MVLLLKLNISWTTESHLGLALSGGIDSMVLYHLLTTTYKDTYKSLTVLHVNHNQRVASLSEAAYIKKMTEKDHVNYESVVLDFEGNFSQESGRKKRYAFFRDIAKKHHLNVLLMAHHEDDQYETVLHQLLTGRYLHGNLGIPEDYERVGVRISRPLMKVRKRDIREYQQAHTVKYFEDESNLEDTYTRNYIRHHIVPDIEDADALDLKQLVNIKNDINELSDFVSDFAKNIISKGSLSRGNYRQYSPLIRIYILNSLLSDTSTIMSRKALESLDQTLMSGPAQTVYQLDSHTVHVEYDQVYVKKAKVSPISEPLIVEDSGNFIYNNYHIVVKLPSDEFPLTIRPRLDGDRVQLKQGGTKKISRLFIDNKIVASERKAIPVVLNQHGIIIAVGAIYNIIEPAENRILKITKEQEDDNKK